MRRVNPGATYRVRKKRLNELSPGGVLIGMKKTLLTFVGAAAIALGFGACAYDPYYTGNTRTSVSVGHGYGHGYGGSAFSTSFFWGTGDSRWGYDPYVRSYYDHHRRAYYDPYLNGYYPIGFRPPILVGVPHPVGYRHGWCPPPRRVNNVTVVNYRNRESAYRNTNHRWARNVSYDSRHRDSGSHAGSRDGHRTRTDTRQFSTPGRDDPNRAFNRSSFDTQRQVGRQSRNSDTRPAMTRTPAPTRQMFGRGSGDSGGTWNRDAVQRGQRGSVDLGRSQMRQRAVSPAPQIRSRFDGERGSRPTPQRAVNDRSNAGGRFQGGRGMEASTSRGMDRRSRDPERSTRR